ncbi:Protein DYAD, partial [Bienertia sinuspersici]
QQLDSQNGQQQLNRNGQQQLDQNGQQHQQILEQQQYQDVEQQHNEEQLTPSTKLTYREKRRLEQAEHRLKYPNKKRRGPTRGKKYVSRTWNSNSEEKIKINFMDELRRVVGEKADEFICDCSNWVKEYCPVDSWNWAKMDKLAKQRLYDKIRVGGADVIEALSLQCSMLYEHWRFRLKEQHFRNKSVAEAINSRPSTINVDECTWLVCEYWNDEKRKRISKINTENKLKQTESPANGARSTARIFHDLMNMPQTQQTEEHEESSNPLETQQDPLYITLFEKTKKHKESGWEPNAQKDYEALKKLHEKEVEKHGEDTLSVKAAYMEVFKHKSGYVRGLGPGAHPPKKSRAEGESNEVRVELSAEIQQLKEDAATREELRTTNEELIASNDELKATVSRINIEAIKREKKLRDDMMKMFEQMRYNAFFSSLIYN